MAVNKVVYGGSTLIDLTGDTVSPSSLGAGITAHDKSGAAIVGTMTAGGPGFTVAGGLIAPASPAENTVWVETGAAISSWEFSAQEPSAPAEGMVWIMAGTSSPVSFSVGEGVWLYPLSAWQYISGAWVSRTAHSYRNGAWADWIVWLYDRGTEHVPMSAGFNSGGSLTKLSDHLHFQCGSAVSVSCSTESKIDVTPFTRMEADVDVTSAGTARIGLDTVRTTNVSSNYPYQSLKTSKTRETVSVDISSATGYYFVVVGARASTTMDVYGIRLY